MHFFLTINVISYIITHALLSTHPHKWLSLAGCPFLINSAKLCNCAKTKNKFLNHDLFFGHFARNWQNQWFLLSTSAKPWHLLSSVLNWYVLLHEYNIEALTICNHSNRQQSYQHINCYGMMTSPDNMLGISILTQTNDNKISWCAPACLLGQSQINRAIHL